MRGTSLILALVLASTAPGAPALAEPPASAKTIAGYVERIRLLPWNHEVKAKLDTGAETSSLHATDIKRTKVAGRSWVRFTAVLDSESGPRRVVVERPLVRRVRIKSARSGSFDHRYSVELELCFDGRRHQAEFTLADRDDMLYPVLLGRRFLAGVAVVDSGEVFLTRSTCSDEPASKKSRKSKKSQKPQASTDKPSPQPSSQETLVR